MSSISKFNKVDKASIAKVMGVSVASINKIIGINWTSDAVTRLLIGIGSGLFTVNNNQLESQGSDFKANLGHNTDGVNTTSPSNVCTSKVVLASSFSTHANIFTDTTGSTWAWGTGTSGQLGDNTITNKSTPIAVCVPANKTFVQLSISQLHCLALDQNGQIWAWGDNANGQLGDNTATCRSTPVAVCIPANKTFCSIHAAWQYSLAVDKDGVGYAWGFNGSGNLGNNDAVSTSSPVVIAGNHTWSKITGQYYHTYGLDTTGIVWAWGKGIGYLLGDGTSTAKSTPIAVCMPSNTTFVDLVSIESAGIAQTNQGALWSWGTNNYGTLGNNTNSFLSTPTAVCLPSGKTVSKLFVGASTVTNYYDNQLIALMTDGSYWIWGANSMGNFDCFSNLSSYPALFNRFPRQNSINSLSYSAIDSYVDNYSPTSGSIKNNIENHLIETGTTNVWAWGANESGCLGDNTTTARTSPVKVCVPSGKTFVQIYSGYKATLALDSDGNGWGWGLATYGALGNNTFTGNVTSPKAMCMPANKCFIKMAAGQQHGVGIDQNGQAWAWGLGMKGVIGDNTAVSKRTPVAVCMPANTTFVDVVCSLDQYTVNALDSTGKLWAWGIITGSFGGVPSITSVSSPIPICMNANLTISKIITKYSGTSMLALDVDGKLWAWGTNRQGEMGTNASGGCQSVIAVCMPSSVTVIDIWKGQFSSFARDTQNRIWAWGWCTFLNPLGQTAAYSSPVIMNTSNLGNRTIKEIRSTGYYGNIITTDNLMWTWGDYVTGTYFDYTIKPYAVSPTCITF